MTFLWRFLWWRFLVVLLAQVTPLGFSNWLCYRSGLTDSLERLFRESGNFEGVRQVRLLRRRMESLYGP